MMAYLHINSWAGHSKHPVEIILVTPKRYKVRLTEDTHLPGRNRHGKAGDEVYVPKYAISKEPAPARLAGNVSERKD